MGSLGGPDIWKITAEERAKHDQQFFTLGPMNGIITGEQARGFFMKSGLPSNVLAQIWGLADLNKDGKMDRREFSIAMGLIQKKLKGFSIPAGLPETMKMDPQPAVGTFGPGTMGTMGAQGAMPSTAMGGVGQTPGMGTWPRMGMTPMQPMGIPQQMPMQGMPMAQGYGMMPQQPMQSAAVPILAAPQPSQGGQMDWSMNQNVKLRHSQLFNNLDKGRVGSLSGVHARNILSQSGLSNPVLAQIWSLSDVDKDGKLTCDEFCIAMFLVDMAKMGHQLPPTLPVVLLPGRQRTGSTGGDGDSGADAAEAEARKQAFFQSFEDKRKQNFDKGQAELERRRQVLQEQERKDREARERKDREEMEKIERERLEKERRRQLEYEKQVRTYLFRLTLFL